MLLGVMVWPELEGKCPLISVNFSPVDSLLWSSYYHVS